MARKNDVSFFCKSCGSEFPRWEGRCATCGEWDTLVEAPRKVSAKGAKGRGAERNGWPFEHLVNAGPKPLSAYGKEEHPRIPVNIGELRRVLGGGIVKGGSILIGGEPGIGKSTLLLQMLGGLAATTAKTGAGTEFNRPLLYISGEEAPSQIADRGRRLSEWKNTAGYTRGHTNGAPQYDFDSDQLLLASANDLEEIIGMLDKIRPSVAVIDSIQTLRDSSVPSAPGSVSQVRETAMALVEAARRLELGLFLVGHVTKDGTLAGPRVLEHIVDCVISFEGETRLDLRVLRSLKNRFGSTHEVGLFEMTGAGLMEVDDPSSVLLDTERDGGRKHESGVTVGAHIEGSRVLLIEIQALTVPVPGGGSPRRRASGLDPNRLAMLLAVLETKGGIPYGALDVFVSAAGGFKIEEPAVDLPLVLALASVATGRPVLDGLVAAGEIGLGGELRPVPRMENRIAEAARMGFQSMILPERGKIPKLNSGNLKILRAGNIREALALGLS